MTNGQQTALDEFVSHVRWCWRLEGPWFLGHYQAVLMTRQRMSKLFSQALQDPCYIQYCKEQDRKEEVIKKCKEGYALQAAHCAAVDRQPFKH